jgi:hypothetical protein
MKTMADIEQLEYSSVVVRDAFTYIIAASLESCDITVEHRIMGYTLRCTMGEDDSSTFALRYQGDEVASMLYPYPRDGHFAKDDILYEVADYFVEALMTIKEGTCSTCGFTFYTRLDITTCTSCITSVLGVSVTHFDANNACCICLMPLGFLAVGCFDCRRHHGHMKCISMYKRKSILNVQYSCPHRCQNILHMDSSMFIDSDSDDVDEEDTEETAAQSIFIQLPVPMRPPPPPAAPAPPPIPTMPDSPLPPLPRLRFGDDDDDVSDATTVLFDSGYLRDLDH